MEVQRAKHDHEQSEAEGMEFEIFFDAKLEVGASSPFKTRK